MESEWLIFYVPNYITINQYQWFNENLCFFTHFKVGGFVFEDRIQNTIDYNCNNPLESIEKLEEKIKEKLVNENYKSIKR
jgi:hypothetical protein